MTRTSSRAKKWPLKKPRMVKAARTPPAIIPRGTFARPGPRDRATPRATIRKGTNDECRRQDQERRRRRCWQGQGRPRQGDRQREARGRGPGGPDQGQPQEGRRRRQGRLQVTPPYRER